MDPSDKTEAIISHDVAVDGCFAFVKGEEVVIESTSADPERPQYRYVVYSRLLQQRFQLSDADLTARLSQQTATRKKILVFDIGILISGIMILASILMPWLNHGGGYFSGTTGLDALLHPNWTFFRNPVLTTDFPFIGPVLPLVFGVLIIVCSSILLARRRGKALTAILIVTGVLTTACAVTDIVRIYMALRPGFPKNVPRPSAGSGLWVLGVFGVLVVVFCFLRIRAARKSAQW